MQASVSAEIRWRIDLYARCFEFCRNGRFSLARFLALVPDRLRLVAGHRGVGIRIPVVVDPELRAVLEQSFGGPPRRSARPKDRAELRRALRISQLDPELDPLWVSWWLRERGDRVLDALHRVYRRGLAEIGRGEGGEEAAYLVHLLLTETVRRSIPREAEPERLLAFAMVRLAHESLLDSPESHSLSARLGFLFEATMSPFAFGADAERMEKRHLNFYRTNPSAVELARRVIQEPIEMIPLKRAAATIAKRLSVDPRAAPALAQETLLERVRDASMLALLELRSPPPLLEEVCRSEQALLQHVSNERRRKVFVDALSARAADSPRAIAALSDLLGAVAPADAEERAAIAAAGAVALVLDEMVERLKRDVTGLVQEVTEVEWREGRAYRISHRDAPLYQLSSDRPEALLYVDLAEIPPGAVAAAELAEQLRVRSVGAAERSMAFRGEVVAAVELAMEIERAVRTVAAELERPRAEMLGGPSRRLEDLEAELASLKERIDVVDAAIRRASDRESIMLLVDGKSSLEKQADLLREVALDLAAPHDLRAPMFIGVGDVSELDGRSATQSVDWIAAARASALEAARHARGEQVAPAFLASIDRRARADLPGNLVRELADAIARMEPAHVAASAAKMAQWLRGEIEARIASPALLAAWTDPPAELHNRGILLSGAALAAWRRAKQPALWFAERCLASSELPDEISRRWVFDRDPERLLLARRAGEQTIVALFRYVGEAGLRAGPATELWEVIRIDSRFADDVRTLESPGDTRRE